MFISKANGRWFFTTQADHSVLVGQIAAFWGNEQFATPKPLRSMIIAAAEHDHSWVREDHQGLLKSDGVPYDFANLPYDRHTSLYAEGARQVASRDVYSGMMVSLHGMGIYNYRHGTDDSMIRPRRNEEDTQIIDSYMEGEKEYQDQLRRELEKTHGDYMEDDVFWTNYHLLQVWDRLGILMSKYQQEDFVIEPAPTDYGGKTTRLSFRSLGECRFAVDPYPFAAPEITFCFIARWLNQIQFGGDDIYRRTLDLTQRIPISYTFLPEGEA
ncbi:MAG: DUF3891 family protein [Verrucomicrobiota bacterium]